MKGIRYAEGLKILPILAPADIVATATATQYIDLKLVNWATLFVQFGAVTSTDSTGAAVVSLQASTAGTSNATELSVAFPYRLSAAVATDTMGALATATTDGASVGQADDNKVLVVDVDPAVIAALGADYRYVRLVVTPTAEVTSTIVSAVAVLEHRFPGNSIPSST